MTLSGVTDEDRYRAALVVAHLPISLGDYRTRDLDAARDVIAQALADERARARAPFLALAEELDHADPDDYEYGPGQSWAASEIRRVAAEDQA